MTYVALCLRQNTMLRFDKITSVCNIFFAWSYLGIFLFKILVIIIIISAIVIIITVVSVHIFNKFV